MCVNGGGVRGYGRANRDKANAVALLPNGDFVVAGTSRSYSSGSGSDSLPLGTGRGDDVFVMRVSGQNSSVLWTVAWLGAGADEGMSVAVTAGSGSTGTENVIVGGTYTNTSFSRGDTDYLFLQLTASTGNYSYSLPGGLIGANDATMAMSQLDATTGDVLLAGTSALGAFVQRLSYVSQVRAVQVGPTHHHGAPTERVGQPLSFPPVPPPPGSRPPTFIL